LFSSVLDFGGTSIYVLSFLELKTSLAMATCSQGAAGVEINKETISLDDYGNYPARVYLVCQ